MIVVLCLLFTLVGCLQKSYAQDLVCFQQHCFRVEVVEEPEDLARGLQFREFLDEDAGMLFIFQKNKRHSFWMKNTLIPLDMLWLDESRQIVDVAKAVPPCRQESCPVYAPHKEARYVLEINARQTDLLGLTIGDQAEFR